MSRAPIALMTAPRRPFMAEPTYIRSHSPSTSNGSAPISISVSPMPMLWLPGASMHALAIHGLTSVSPMPVTPSSVWISTMMSSWAELAAVMS